MAGQRSILAALLVCALPRTCWAHGKLTSPVPRDGISAGRAGLDENNPVSFEPGCSDPMNRCDAFVCREAAPNPSVGVTQVTAGGTLQLQWAFTAFHVGDCSVYISYDVEVARPQQRWVKVANLPDCKSYPSASITIPASLPAGRAILRWDWAALHIWPTVEFYVQCADIQISSSSPSTPADLDSYPLTAPPVYPDSGNDGVGYRNAFNSALALANVCSGPYCKSGGSLLASSAATTSDVAIKRHAASVVDEPGHGLRAFSPRRTRAAAQVALIQRSVIASLGEEVGQDDPASGLPEPTAEL
jgi:hypothetical protein